MTAKLMLMLGAIYGFGGVACGAFGSHALRARLTPEMLAGWRTGVEYQFWHALALIAVPVPARGRAGFGSARGRAHRASSRRWRSE